MAPAGTVEAEVRCAGISYFVDEDRDGFDKPLRIRHEARFGETVDLPKDEFARLEELEAVQKPGSAPLASGVAVRTVFTTSTPGEANNLGVEAEPDVEVGTVPIDVAGVTDEALAAYIKDNKLKVPDVVALAGDDPELAAKVLSAEEDASDGSPRKTAVEGLQAMIDAGGTVPGDEPPADAQ